MWSPLNVVALETTIDTLCAPNGVIGYPLPGHTIVLSGTASGIEMPLEIKIRCRLQ